MAATPAPEPHEVSAPAEAPAAEPRHLQPVPAEDSEPDEPAELDERGENTEDDEPGPGGGVDVSGWFDWTRAVFSPQSGLWTTRPSAPDEVVDRARHGQQVADAGPLRVVSAAHGYASAGAKLVLRASEWVFFEHLARAVVGLVLLTALCLYPPTATALGYALTPLVWAHDLLT